MVIIVIIILIGFLTVLFWMAKKRSSIEKFKSNENKNELAGKTILITGSTAGFGLLLAQTLIKLPINLFITGKDHDKTIETINSLEKINKNVWGKSADFTKHEEIKALWEAAVKKFGKIDIVIHIPIKSYTRFKISDTDIESWRGLMEKNMDNVVMLNNLASKHMRQKSIKGRIINVTSFKGNLSNTKIAQGAEILANTQIEKYSEILSGELYSQSIAVCTIRFDKDIGSNFFNYEYPIKPNKMAQKILKGIKRIPELLGGDPKKIIPVFIHCIKAPFEEVTGKIFSSDAFSENKDLAKLVSNDVLNKNKDHYTYFKETKEKKDKHTLFLNKQVSIKQNKQLKISLNPINVYNKYHGKLNELLAKETGVQKENIVLFRTEYDALKKLMELFLSKGNNILLEYPCWTHLVLYCKEHSVETNYMRVKIDDKKETHVNYTKLIDSINEKTKIIYLSSPSTVSGQSINKKKFKYIMKSIPKHIIVILDQRFLEASIMKNPLDGIDYLNYPNLVILRSMNNFYSIENLTIGYIISNIKLAELIDSKTLVDDIDSFTAKLAIDSLKDRDYIRTTKKLIKSQNQSITKDLKKHNIDFIPSETNYLLIEANRSRGDVAEDFERENMILYESIDEVDDYWTLPISMKSDVNTKVINILNYSD